MVLSRSGSLGLISGRIDDCPRFEFGSNPLQTCDEHSSYPGSRVGARSDFEMQGLSSDIRVTSSAAFGPGI